MTAITSKSPSVLLRHLPASDRQRLSSDTIPALHPVSKDILLTREVVRRAMLRGLFDLKTGQLIVDAWVKVEVSRPIPHPPSWPLPAFLTHLPSQMNTVGADDETRAKLFGRLLALHLGPRAREYTKLVYRGKHALMQEVRLKMIEKQLVDQQQELRRNMAIIQQKQRDVDSGFDGLVNEVHSAVRTMSSDSPSQVMQCAIALASLTTARESPRGSPTVRT